MDRTKREKKVIRPEHSAMPQRDRKIVRPEHSDHSEREKKECK